jgi:hypothetical protein
VRRSLVLVLLGFAWLARGTAAPVPTRQLLDAIRTDLVELRLEHALAAIETLLGDPSLAPADRLEALILRAQAHAALGDFDAAEADYRLILASRPAYEPEPTLIPAKAMERFRKVRSQLVGTVLVTLEPRHARLTVDGQEALPGPDGVLRLLAGEREVRAEAAGFDPAQVRLTVQPGGETPLHLQLMPNARSVVILTEPDGVDVHLDGVVVGRTARVPAGQEPGPGPPPAVLTIDNLAPGEHLFEFHKPCYATDTLRDVLTVDLLDHSPKRYGPVVLEPSRATLAVAGAPGGAEVIVDGRVVGELPLREPLIVCPGVVQLEVRSAGRAIWRSDVPLEQGESREIEVGPRPNAALVGTESWPDALGPTGSLFSMVRGLRLPEGTDLTRAEGWSAVALPPDTDLALAELPAEREGGASRWVVYSPPLRTVEVLDAASASAVRPEWRRPLWGLTVADSRHGGGVVVVEVAQDGPAARGGVRVGDRMTAVSGEPVRGAAGVRKALAAAEGPMKLRLADPAPAGREVTLEPGWSPALLRAWERPRPWALLAAWASVDAVASADRAPAALANLALMAADSNDAALAAETWRRVRWDERPGIGRATAAFYLAQALLTLGHESEAIEQLRRAARSGATTSTDEGPALAPAAMDYLADLGVAPEEVRATAR